MKIYSKESYNSYQEFQESFINELKQAFIGTKVSYRDADAYFSDFSISNSNLGEHIGVGLDVNGEVKNMIIDLAINSGIVKLPEDVKKVYDEFVETYTKSKEVYDTEVKARVKEAEEKHKAYLARIEAERVRKEELRKQIEADKRYAKKVERALTKLNSIKREDTSKLFEAPTTHYEILGWMAKHLTSIRAAMPDYMEKWFISKFGDANRTVVDSKKRTVNGFPMQWGLSLKLTFDEEVKGPLEQRATSQNKKTIDNVAFVWDLIENYGFQFGKEQNISQIKAEIPEENLVDFEKGYAM